MLPEEFSGHGTYIYQADKTIQKYGSAKDVAKAMIDMDMKYAWVRIHGKDYITPKEPTQSLIDALANNDLKVAGWGLVPGRKTKQRGQNGGKGTGKIWFETLRC